jgi:hypothetical protein
MFEKVNLNQNTIGIHELVSSLRSGKKVKVGFKKKDNSDRIMQCTLDFGRIPKEHYPKGVKTASEVKTPEFTSYFNVYDEEKKGWRKIPLYKLDWVNVDGKQYTVEYEEGVTQK